MPINIQSLDLTQSANQSHFAELVGVSQPSINTRVKKGILKNGGTYQEWLKQYCEHLREGAAGRGGSLADEQARARIEELKVKAANGRLDYFEKTGDLVPVSDAEKVLVDWADFANREFLACINNLKIEISRQSGVEVDGELVNKIVGTSIRRIQSHAEKLASDFDVSGE